MTIYRTDFSQFDRQFILDRIKVEPPRGCWQWQGSINVHGRATYSHVYAYRIAYTIFVGPLNGMQVNHHCDNPACVNPDHIYAGTRQQNTDDMWRRGRGVLPISPRGEDHYMGYPNALVNEIRSEVAAGRITKGQAAQKYGVAVAMVTRWMNGERADLDPIPSADERFKPRQPCGTRATYYRHRKDGDPRCDPCWEANRLYMIAWKAKRAQAKADTWLGTTPTTAAA